MTIGPVQLLVVGFEHPEFQGEILDELQRLKDNDLVCVIDGLAVQKGDDGSVDILRGTQMSGEEQAEFGAVVGELLGIGAFGVDGAEPGAILGAETVEERGGVLDPELAWDALEEIPEGSAAALILLEHRWAIPLRDAIARAGGFRLASEFISPLDLVALGMVAAEEAERIEASEAGTF